MSQESKLSPDEFLATWIVVIIFCLLVWAGVLYPIITANCFVTERGALRAVQITNSSAIKLVDINRGIYSYSQATIEDVNLGCSIYQLDANILFNVKAIL